MNKLELGAFQISRSIFDSEIWNKSADWLKIWIYILGNVNYSDSQNFKRGENFFRYDIIANNCQVKYNSVAKCMLYLKLARQIEIKKSTRGALISVVNFDIYQNLNTYGKTEARQKQEKSDTIKKEEKKKRNINNILPNGNMELAPLDKRKNEIDEFIFMLKDEVRNLGLSYKTGKQERNRVQNILTAKDFGEISENVKMSRRDFALNILRISIKLDFWKGKIYNAETLYKHYASVYNEAVKIKEKYQTSNITSVF